MIAKHQKFVSEYLKDFNATQAAIRSGYSAKCAQVQGSRLLSNAMIAKAVRDAREEVANEGKVTLAGHIQALRDLRDKAAEAEQYGPAITAETNRGKVCGLYIERQEHTFPELSNEDRTNRVAAILNSARQRATATNGNGKH